MSPTAHDQKWQKGIDRFKRLQSMEASGVRNDDWPLVNREARATVIEKLFSYKQNLSYKLIYDAIALFDRFITGKDPNYEHILAAGLVSLGLSIQEDLDVSDASNNNFVKFLSSQFDKDTLNEVNEEVSKQVIDESDHFYLEYVSTIKSLLLARTSEAMLFIDEIVGMVSSLLRSVIIDVEIHRHRQSMIIAGLFSTVLEIKLNNLLQKSQTLIDMNLQRKVCQIWEQIVSEVFGGDTLQEIDNFGRYVFLRQK